eukprot:gene14695-17362_t
MPLSDPDYEALGLGTTLRELLGECYNPGAEKSDLENTLERRDKKKKFSAPEQLFYYLHIMASPHTTWQSFEAKFGCDKATVMRLYYHVQSSIFRVTAPEISWPDEDERRELAERYCGAFAGCLGYVNGTRSGIKKPLHCQTALYSGKIAMHCVNTQVIVDLTGKFIQGTVGVAGSVHDKIIYDAWDGYVNEETFSALVSSSWATLHIIPSSPHTVFLPTRPRPITERLKKLSAKQKQQVTTTACTVTKNNSKRCNANPIIFVGSAYRSKDHSEWSNRPSRLWAYLVVESGKKIRGNLASVSRARCNFKISYGGNVSTVKETEASHVEKSTSRASGKLGKKPL